jgi:hypothetical protein
MRKYLDLSASAPEGDVASLDGRFDPDRFFCLVGTNYRDYAVGMGAVREVVGPMSDGLVRVANATVYGPARGGSGRHQSPRAFVNRSHSGHYGIVNSESGYQNLTRFLFGDVRVDAVLEVKEISLPPKIQEAFDKNKDIRASYHFEVILRTRGALWSLHRRTAEECSAVFRTFDEMLRPGPRQSARYPHLFSAFLALNSRVNKRRASLGFSLDLGVLVPQYEVDGFMMFDHHYDGGYIFRDKLNFEVVQPDKRRPTWRLDYGFDSGAPNQVEHTAEYKKVGGRGEFRIPIEKPTRPGLKAELVLRVAPWNRD